MNILALIGSPRKGSNTDTLAERVLQGSKAILLGYSPDSEIEGVYIFSDGSGLFVQSRNSGEVLKPWYSKVQKADVSAFFIKETGPEGNTEKHLYVDADCHEAGIVDRGLGKILKEHEEEAQEIVDAAMDLVRDYNTPEEP